VTTASAVPETSEARAVWPCRMTSPAVARRLPARYQRAEDAPQLAWPAPWRDQPPLSIIGQQPDRAPRPAPAMPMNMPARSPSSSGESICS